jgi:TPR repeat protein
MVCTFQLKVESSAMNKILALVCLFFMVSTSFAENIIPPKDAKPDAVILDMWSCINTAKRAASGDGQLLKGFDKELLQGHSTIGYLFETTLSGPRPIEPKPDGVLAPRESLFNALGSSARTDPYVVCLLLKGYRWESSKETGFETLQRLADQGNARAQAELGRAYYLGLGVTRNNSLAFNLLKAAATANDPDGQFNLAILYAQGDGVLPDDNMSAQWLKKAAGAGHQQAQRALPQAEQIAAARRKSIDESAAKLNEIQSKAEAGNIESQRTLANYYIEGIGVAPDANKAIDWYRKAAASGDAVAMTQIGVMYDKGRGVAVDYAEAVRWYKLAAEKGNSQAQYNLGIFTYYGVGTEQNREQGKEWVHRAAEQGNRLAINALESLR